MASERAKCAFGESQRSERSSRLFVGFVVAGLLAILNFIPTSAWQGALWHAGWDAAVPLPAATPDAAVEEPVEAAQRVAVGDRLPDAVLTDLDGREVRLLELTGRVPLVVEFGSFT